VNFPLTAVYNMSKINVKDEVVPPLSSLIKHNAINAYWGNGSIAPCILDFGTR